MDYHPTKGVAPGKEAKDQEGEPKKEHMMSPILAAAMAGVLEEMAGFGASIRAVGHVICRQRQT